MSTRVQESPFRETEWDQRLDRMLDDLKTTVGPEVSSPDVRHDSSLVSSFRSSSRNGERSSESQSRGDSRSRSGSAIGIEDGGRVKHTRHEYKPDDNSKVVTEKFEYDTGDSNDASHYQKKVIKSTYSTFSHQTAGSLDDPPHLLEHAPESPPERPPTNTKGSTTLHNGTNGQQTQQYDADEEEEDYTKSGEVRRIVWRNRYEKTYEASDAQQAPQPPAITIEEEARRRQRIQQQNLYSSTSTTSTLSQNSPPQRGVASPHSSKSSQPHSPRASQPHSPRASQSQSPRASQPHSPKLQSVMYWPGLPGHGLPGHLPGSGYNVSQTYRNNTSVTVNCYQGYYFVFS